MSKLSELSKLCKKSFSVPYEDNLKYPPLEEAKELVARYCANEGWACEFTGTSEEGNPIVSIDNVPHELLRGMLQAQSGYGGYGIKCREL